MEGTAGELSLLPEGCISHIISFTSPRDACRLSCVSTIFKSAAGSDAVWKGFLPPEYHHPTHISNSASSSSLLGFSSKKELYMSLCDNPILIDEGRKSFALDKHSGKKCYMISARDLRIIWSGTPLFWRWSESLPGARFPEVAELVDVYWLEICGRISTHGLSPQTLYSAYFVYKLMVEVVGFENQPVQASVALVGIKTPKRDVYFDPKSGRRHDGWLEIELGDFFNEGDEEGDVEMNVLELIGGKWKSGIIVQGIEIRPKQGK